jgi:hypothetical protein
MSARPITKIAVVQFSLVVIFFTVLGIAMKIAGYPHDPFVRWNPFSVFLRTYGMWMLLVPALWVAVCLFAERKWPDAWDDSDTLCYGIMTALLIIGVFVFAAVTSHTRPLIRVTGGPAGPAQAGKVSQRFKAVEEPPAPAERPGP